MKLRVGLAALLMLGAGCTAIGHQQVLGWPELEIIEYHVPTRDLYERCSRYMGVGMLPEACAEFDLTERRCHIWLSADFPPPRYVVEHERLHCRGYDHIGMSTMKGILERYRARVALSGGGR
jgi:hypothetical protein